MKERPILFSGEMVRAILDGRKTQTRRVKYNDLHKCPYEAGMRLWVRETWATSRFWDDTKPSEILNHTDDPSLWYMADGESYRHLGERRGRTRSSLFMPRWASRITLEVTAVRCELLQDISEADAVAEGVGSDRSIITATDRFTDLWDSINRERVYSWASNPRVWVVSFEVVD